MATLKKPKEDTESKIVYKPLFVTTNSMNGATMITVPLVSQGAKVKDMNTPMFFGSATPGSCSFGLQGSPTGCGLGIFYGFTGWPHTTMTEEDWNFVVEVIHSRVKPLNWYCLIATIGDTHLKTHGAILDRLGFKKTGDFNNKNHGNAYKQHIYLAVVADMK